MPAINIRTTLPGPKGQAVLDRRDAAVSRASFRSTPVVAASAHNATVTDVDGNTFIDFTAGIGTLNVGHTPPEVVAALQAQAADLIHLCAIVGTYEPYIALAEKLNSLVPIDGPKKTFLSNSGAEGVETAIKMARAYTGRPAIVTYEGAYHGRTLLTLSLTSKYALFKKSFGPFAPEIYRVPYPYAYRCPHCRNEGACNLTCFEDLERALLAHVDPAAVAAIIIEPVQGEGGFIPPTTNTCAACASFATSTASCSSPMRCRPASAARGAGSPSSTAASSPIWWSWPSPSPRGCRWPRSPARRRSSMRRTWAVWAALSAAIRWPASPRSRASN
jgi:4-aminobutyrate aminotransferase/(S)-3-amino-2-methylpropionate transaminase